MGEPVIILTNDGQEVEQDDVDNLGAIAGLADDRVLAEILRITPYDGNIYKGIIPYGYRSPIAGAFPGGTVQSSGSANGSIIVSPFRCIIGSRNAANAAPPGANPAANYQPNSLANWRDIRSGVFVGSSISLTSTIVIAANASGNPRWDLVYAILSLDANGPSVSRRVKSPSTSVVSVQSVPSWLQSPVTVGVVQGTPGGSPALPAIPADSAGNYNVPLAYVYVPNGFGAASTVLSKNIRGYANATSTYMQAGHGVAEPCSGANDRTGTYATNFPWATAGRPGPFIPPDMVGGVEKFVLIDAYSGGANWSIPHQGIIDNSIDWRNRITLVDFAIANNTLAGIAQAHLATDPSSGGAGTSSIPWATYASAGGGGDGGSSGYNCGRVMGNSCPITDNLGPGAGNPVILSLVPAGGMVVDLYVDHTTGALKFYGTTGSTTIGYLAFWIRASAPLPNY